MSNYQDVDGNPITLDKLVRTEPEWAANVIRTLKAQLAAAQAADSGDPDVWELCHNLAAAQAELERVRDALEFYANPEVYFAVGFACDPPCGGFDEDFEWFDEDFNPADGTGENDRPRPGKTARLALGVEPGIPFRAGIISPDSHLEMTQAALKTAQAELADRIDERNAAIREAENLRAELEQVRELLRTMPKLDDGSGLFAAAADTQPSVNAEWVRRRDAFLAGGET